MNETSFELDIIGNKKLTTKNTKVSRRFFVENECVLLEMRGLK